MTLETLRVFEELKEWGDDELGEGSLDDALKAIKADEGVINEIERRIEATSPDNVLNELKMMVVASLLNMM